MPRDCTALLDSLRGGITPLEEFVVTDHARLAG
jgi:hypothetical protein